MQTPIDRISHDDAQIIKSSFTGSSRCAVNDHLNAHVKPLNRTRAGALCLVASQVLYEPCHEVMVLFVLHKCLVLNELSAVS